MKTRGRRKQREGGCLIGLVLSAVIAVCDSFAISLPKYPPLKIANQGGRPRLFSSVSSSSRASFVNFLCLGKPAASGASYGRFSAISSPTFFHRHCKTKRKRTALFSGRQSRYARSSASRNQLCKRSPGAIKMEVSIMASVGFCS